MPRKTTSASTAIETLPVLPLRDVVVYPNMVIPLFVGREKSMHALEVAMENERQILLVAQKSPDTDDPKGGDLYNVGTLAGVLQLLKLPDGTVKVLVEGQSRVAIDTWNEEEALLAASSHSIESDYGDNPRELEVVSRTLISLFEQLVKQSRKLPPEILSTLSGIDDPSRLADSIAAHLNVRLADKQQVLETLDVGKRL
ncbi:MAG TPA: LON peptidase substrate-binding domain-containing protein, partial [Rhodanobacteraceae bacterium]|nr:LON peptidase substrate-binding domain-containing protein [Rhodanobacteraceae bacterium]